MNTPDNTGQQDSAYDYPQPMRIRSTGQPPKTKRKRTTPLWATIAVGVVAFGIGTAAGGSKNDTTANAGSPMPAVTTVYVTAAAPAPVVVTTTVPAATSKPAPAPATSKAAPAPAPKPTTPAPPATKTVLHVSGNGIKTTQNFTTGPEWSLTYTFNCAGFGGTGNFAVMENGGTGSVLVNALAAKGSDVTYQHGDAGTHSLEMNSECDWTITVTDGG